MLKALTLFVRLLLRLFPASFRRRHGPEYLATLSALGEERRHRGIVGAIRLTSFVIPDLLAALPRAWNDTGSVDALKSRPAGGTMESLWQDLRYAIERVREIGIRMALGADGNTIVRLVLRQILTVVVIGGALGLAGSIALSGSIRALVFGVSPNDPVTLAAVVVLLSAVATGAAAIPALRAARVPAVAAVRAE